MLLLGEYAAPERRLIASILNAAIFDSLHSLPMKPIEKPIGTKYARKHKLNNPNFVDNYPPYLSWDSRNFISLDNKLFCTYAWMLDIDPSYLSEKIWKNINLSDELKLIIFYFTVSVASYLKRKNGNIKMVFNKISKEKFNEFIFIYHLLCLRPLMKKIHKGENESLY